MAYRTAGGRPESAEHFYRSARARSDARFRIGVMSMVPSFAASLVIGAIVSPGVGFLSFFGAFFVSWKVGSSIGDAAGMTLRVADGTLEVARGRSRSVLFRTPLRDLHDVELETFEKLGALTNVRPVGNFGMPTGGGPGVVEESRIVLVLESGKTFPLNDRDTSPTEASEDIGEIKSFLRDCGWSSAVERGIVDEQDEQDDDEEDEDDDDE